jgi:hypothetical protein
VKGFPYALRIIVLCVFGSGCRGKTGNQSPAPSEAFVAPAGAGLTLPFTSKANGGTDELLLDWINLPAECIIEHRGTLLDFGDVSVTRSRIHGSARVRALGLNTEHEGATWLQVSGRDVSVPFRAESASNEGETIALHARTKGGVARSMSFVLNGHPIGLASQTKGKVSVASFKSSTATILAGENELAIRFNGTGKSGDVVGEIDWVNIGRYDDDTPYAAPTRADAVGTVTIGNVPRRSLSLRGPGSSKCIVHLHGKTKFRAQVAVLGRGETDLEVRVHRDRVPTVIAGALHLAQEPEWRPIEVDLSSEPGLAEIELAVVNAAKGARVVFADPKVVSTDVSITKERSTPEAKSAVVIVLGSTPPHAVSVYGGTNEVPVLGSLAASGVVFETHRNATSSAAGTLASILTGLDGNDHRVTDSFAKLPSGLTTIADCAREGGILTAFFTANPGTSAAFGMNRGFSTYGFVDPTDALPATKVFDDAAEWIARHRDGRFLLVIHARGGHPPWDATAAQLREMPPLNYTGGVDAKHGGEYLARIRTTRGAHFSDMDRTRLFALYNLAVTTDDTALGRLLDTLRSLHRDEDTALILTSDVGLDSGSRVPFTEAESLSEEALASILVMRAPSRNAVVAERRTYPSTAADLAVTVLSSLGLKPPGAFRGANLWSVNGSPAQPRPRIAWLGRRYSLSLGGFSLTGGDGAIRLCDALQDPSCGTDVRGTYPVAFARLLSAVDQRIHDIRPQEREFAQIDTATSNALRLWGRNYSSATKK